jgi:hypothetical protein
MKIFENSLFFHQRGILRQSKSWFMSNNRITISILDIKITSNEFRSQKIIHISWLSPSFLLSLFYSSMILAQLLASTDKPIHTLNDLANAEDAMVMVHKNTNKELFIKVIK